MYFDATAYGLLEIHFLSRFYWRLLNAHTFVGSLAVRAAAETDPKKRIVVTGMGVVSCFGNDVDTFYDRCGLSLDTSPSFPCNS